MSAEQLDLENTFAFCATEHTSLTDLWSEIERTLCHRDKTKPPRILIDLRHTLFTDEDVQIELFKDSLSHGMWADIINDGGRFAVVIGTQENVCICGELALLEALADVSDRSDALRILPTTQQAVRWLSGGTSTPVARDGEYEAIPISAG